MLEIYYDYLPKIIKKKFLMNIIPNYSPLESIKIKGQLMDL